MLIRPPLTTSSVYSVLLSVVHVEFVFDLDKPDGYLVGKKLGIWLSKCLSKKLCFVILFDVFFYSAWCLCWEYAFN